MQFSISALLLTSNENCLEKAELNAHPRGCRRCEESESINKINERSNNPSTSIQGRYVIDVV